MDGNKEDNNFWEEEKDDFWSKPVISDDWLKEETAVFKVEPDDKEDSFDKNLNPFIESHKHDDLLLDTEVPEKKKHIHTIICLSSILITVLLISICIITIIRDKNNAVSVNKQLSYEEIEVDASFCVYDNNMVMLEDQAYTIIDADTVSDFPKGEKLIAIYVQVNSEEYKFGKYALEECFVSYQMPEGEEYRLGIYSTTILPYISSLGFTDEDLLSIYGIGNGSNEQGYFFYLVPKDVERITFYAMEKDKVSAINIVSYMYEKEMAVLGSDKTELSELTGRRTR